MSWAATGTGVALVVAGVALFAPRPPTLPTPPPPAPGGPAASPAATPPAPGAPEPDGYALLDRMKRQRQALSCALDAAVLGALGVLIVIVLHAPDAASPMSAPGEALGAAGAAVADALPRETGVLVAAAAAMRRDAAAAAAAARALAARVAAALWRT